MAGGDTTIDLACVGKKLICDNWSVPSTTALSGAALLETPDAITKCLAQQAALNSGWSAALVRRRCFFLSRGC